MTEFNTFCMSNLDGLYTPELPIEQQSTGYILLRQMIEQQIDPAPIYEIERWETRPTKLELTATPELKYLRFLHPLLRKYVINNWQAIKKLQI